MKRQLERLLVRAQFLVCMSSAFELDIPESQVHLCDATAEVMNTINPKLVNTIKGAGPWTHETEVFLGAGAC